MEIEKTGENQRRSQLGLGVASQEPLGKLDKDNLGSGSLKNDIWKLLRRSKELLSMRKVTTKQVRKLDYRKCWNQGRAVETVLDLFPSLKYSYSSLRGKKAEDTINVLSNGKSARVGDIAQSHSIRLDPVDSPKQLYKYSRRIQRVLEWARGNDLVPVMMTLTLYHRWHALLSLCNILKKSWQKLFSGCKAGMERRRKIDLRGYIRRMEETINDGTDLSESNTGWHPHYHVILIVPRSKLQELSAYELELKEAWFNLVCRYHKQEFGEEIPASYSKTLKEHGLIFSRYKSAEHAANCGCVDGKAGDLLEVPHAGYLTKTGITAEDCTGGKRGKRPFELLRGEVTANLADLWCEYALATKNISSFSFSKGLQSVADEYFNAHHEQLTLPLYEMELPVYEIVAQIKPTDYQWLYRQCQIGNLLEKAKDGVDAVKKWLKESFNIDVVEKGAVAESEAVTFAERKILTVIIGNNRSAIYSVFLRVRVFRVYLRRLKCLIKNRSPPFCSQNF